MGKDFVSPIPRSLIRTWERMTLSLAALMRVKWSAVCKGLAQAQGSGDRRALWAPQIEGAVEAQVSVVVCLPAHYPEAPSGLGVRSPPSWSGVCAQARVSPRAQGWRQKVFES